MITAGIPVVLVSKLLRHTQLATTADLYTHLTDPAAARAAALSTPPSPGPPAPCAGAGSWTGCDHHATSTPAKAPR